MKIYKLKSEKKESKYDCSTAIILFGTSALVYGDIHTMNKYFNAIKRRPPNKYGNFFNREKAGLKACYEILEKYKDDFELIKET